MKDSSSEVMNPQYILLSIDILKEVNKIPTAQLVLLDGDPATQTFAVSQSNFFTPGEKIRIQLRYEAEDDVTVFVGYIVRQSLHATPKTSTLTLYLKDAAIKLTQQRKNAIFREQDDISIIQAIISSVNQTDGADDLKPRTFKPETLAVTHPEMVQYCCSDWDFILSRAAANGLWILVDNGFIDVQAPDSIEGDALSIAYGLDELYDVEMEADIREQFTSVNATAWSAADQDLAEIQTGDEYVLGQPNLQRANLGQVIGADHCQLVSGIALDPTEMKTWASATIAKTRLSMVQGRLQVPGRADVKPGDELTLENFSDPFNGKTLITGIRHQISEGGWQTHLQFGLSATPFAPPEEIMPPPADGLLPAVRGLQVGVVQQADLKDECRVQVKIPRLKSTTAPTPTDKHDGLVWAHLTTVEGGVTADGNTERGIFFRPETGDEVILGFLNEDPRQAVILGALTRTPKSPLLPIAAGNPEKGIITKQQLKFVFNDDKKSMTLETPGVNTIIVGNLPDDDQGIQITDQHKNKFVMNAKGIQVSSDKDIAITAKGSISLKGNTVDVE